MACPVLCTGGVIPHHRISAPPRPAPLPTTSRCAGPSAPPPLTVSTPSLPANTDPSPLPPCPPTSPAPLPRPPPPQRIAYANANPPGADPRAEATDYIVGTACRTYMMDSVDPMQCWQLLYDHCIPGYTNRDRIPKRILYAEEKVSLPSPSWGKREGGEALCVFG